jgi:hypothetical protein
LKRQNPFGYFILVNLKRKKEMHDFSDRNITSY